MNKSQKPKKKEENLNSFLQSDEYQVLNENLQAEVNHNSEMFNIELPNGKNLLKKTNLIPKYDFKKTEAEREKLKQEKKLYKLTQRKPK